MTMPTPDPTPETQPTAEPEKPAAKPRVSIEKKNKARRRFLRSAALVGGLLGISMLAYIPRANSSKVRLRPPGSLDEADFLASCIKCGQCVQVCPVEAIKLADMLDGFGVGVPYIDAREQACDFSCDAIQCVLACPTGALVYDKPDFMRTRPGAKLAALPILKAKEGDPDSTLNLNERFGLARLSRPESCLAIQGRGFKGQTRGANFKGKMRYVAVDRWKPIYVKDHPYDVPLCDLCVRECPVKDAIELRPVTGNDGVVRMTPVVLEPCVGCGVCEMVCPAEPAAITIEAQAVWKK